MRNKKPNAKGNLPERLPFFVRNGNFLAANRNEALKKLSGFTFMEILTVVILVGILAAFGVPAYNKVVQKGYERNAIMAVTTIHQANDIYLKQNGEYLPGVNLDLAQINTALDLDITSADLDFNYRRTGAAPGNYLVDARWQIGGGGPVEFIIRSTHDPLDLPGGTNPCCFMAGTCFTLPDC